MDTVDIAALRWALGQVVADEVTISKTELYAVVDDLGATRQRLVDTTTLAKEAIEWLGAGNFPHRMWPILRKRLLALAADVGFTPVERGAVAPAPPPEGYVLDHDGTLWGVVRWALSLDGEDAYPTLRRSAAGAPAPPTDWRARPCGCPGPCDWPYHNGRPVAPLLTANQPTKETEQ